MDKNQLPPPYGAHIPNQPMPMPMTHHPAPAVQIIGQANVGPDPQRYVCNYCQSNITTQIRHEPSSKTHLIALVCCLLGCWCCVCVPYCVDSCQSTNHYCPACNAFLGSYQN